MKKLTGEELAAEAMGEVAGRKEGLVGRGWLVGVGLWMARVMEAIVFSFYDFFEWFSWFPFFGAILYGLSKGL